MKYFLSNFTTNVITAWIIVSCGAIAFQHNTASWLKFVLCFVIFIVLDLYVYIKNKIKY